MLHRHYVFTNTERLLDPTIQEACPFLRRSTDPLDYARGFVQHGRITGQAADLYEFEFEGQKLVAAAIVPPGGKAIDLAKWAANEFLRLMGPGVLADWIKARDAKRKSDAEQRAKDRAKQRNRPAPKADDEDYFFSGDAGLR